MVNCNAVYRSRTMSTQSISQSGRLPELACVSILIEGNRREDSAHIQSIELMSIIISLLISSSQLHAGAAAAACVQLLEVDSRGNKISMARVHRCIIWSPLIHPSSHHRVRHAIHPVHIPT